MSYLSHDVLVPNQSVHLGPFSVVQARGEICNPTRSAVRALHILELLASAERPLRAVEIAGPLGLSPSSANLLLKAMVDSAYLIFDSSSKRYFPAPRVAKLGVPVTDHYFGAGTIDRLMGVVQEELEPVSIMVTLSTCQGAYMQMLDSVRSPRRAGKVSPYLPKPRATAVEPLVGVRIPLFGSAIGAAWLAAQNERRIRAAIKLCRRELGRAAEEPDAILESVRRVAKQGHAFGGISAHDEVRGLAVALPISRDGIVLVLGTCGQKDEMETRRDQIAETLTRNIGSLLGGDMHP